MALTKTVIDRAKYDGDGKSRCFHWDDQPRGFGLRVFPSGARSFVFSYRFQGASKLITIGPYGPLTLQQARQQANRLAVQVIDGKDPLAERTKARHGSTMKDVCAAYMTEYAIGPDPERPRKKSWSEDERRINRFILPKWGTRQAKSITRTDVLAFHRELGKSSIYEANRVLALLAVIFKCARTWGMLPEGAVNPANEISKFKEKKRDRWVTPQEMPRLAAAIDEVRNPYIRAALWLYIFTGVRRSELLKVRWTDINLEQRALFLPDTKSGHPHVVPLSGPAVALIQGLSPVVGNPYLLPGRHNAKHLKGIAKVWKEVRKRADLEDVRLHDLRRTVGSWLANSGNALLVVAKTLNHRDIRTTQKVYAKIADDPVRTALEAHGKAILKASGVTRLKAVK